MAERVRGAHTAVLKLGGGVAQADADIEDFLRQEKG